MASQNKPTTPNILYCEASLIYIQYHAIADTKANGEKTIDGKRPAYTKIAKQPKYTKWSGDYYSLPMGREFQTGRWVNLLDFDNKVEGDLQSGAFSFNLNMNQYKAPTLLTPSKGCHYIFHVDAEQSSKMTNKYFNNIARAPTCFWLIDSGCTPTRFSGVD